jgi:hypothetical protein
MTLIIQNHWGIVTGTFTSIIDTYLNLKLFDKDVKLATISNHEKPSDLIKFFFSNSNFGSASLMATFTKEREFDSDTIICSARLLADCINDPSIKIRAKKLIVLDSLDLARMRYGIGPDINQAVKVDECIFLVNPANLGSTRFKELVYYHKFNKKRLDTKHFSDIKLTYSRNKKEFIKISDNKYYENIGKGIFEYAYKGYPVTYSPDGLFVNDGLCCYLELVGVNPFKHHNPMKLSKYQIIKHLCMHENDLLLELI